jgi:hypothetical protein
MKIIKHVLALAVLSLLNAGVSYACVCLSAMNAKEGLAKAEAVFSGRVIKSDGYVYEFEVESVWKGRIVTSRITVAAAAPGTSCAIELSQGERYVVFARSKKEDERTIYSPQICNLTSIYSRAGHVLKGIGKGKLLKKEEPQRPEDEHTRGAKPHISLNRTRSQLVSKVRH